MPRKRRHKEFKKKKRGGGNGGHQKYNVLLINIIKAYMDWQRLGSTYMISQLGTSWGL